MHVGLLSDITCIFVQEDGNIGAYHGIVCNVVCLKCNLVNSVCVLCWCS